MSVPPAFADLTLADIEAVRLLLSGDSVIDWHSLSFGDHEEVDRFLRLNEFDPDSRRRVMARSRRSASTPWSICRAPSTW
ncbi:MAG: hypothetical protein HC863_03110 [Myxococcales bacterium]|nr:hypothetical protein [Myxococcales bacterium]